MKKYAVERVERDRKELRGRCNEAQSMENVVMAKGKVQEIRQINDLANQIAVVEQQNRLHAPIEAKQIEAAKQTQ